MRKVEEKKVEWDENHLAYLQWVEIGHHGISPHKRQWWHGLWDRKVDKPRSLTEHQEKYIFQLWERTSFFSAVGFMPMLCIQRDERDPGLVNCHWSSDMEREFHLSWEERWGWKRSKWSRLSKRFSQARVLKKSRGGIVQHLDCPFCKFVLALCVWSGRLFRDALALHPWIEILHIVFHATISSQRLELLTCMILNSVDVVLHLIRCLTFALRGETLV